MSRILCLADLPEQLTWEVIHRFAHLGFHIESYEWQSLFGRFRSR